MIQFRHVFKRYPGGYDALRNIDFELRPGEMAFLTGHSGAGKSTLLRLIALIERPTRGEALVNGRNLKKLPRRRIPAFRRDLGVVFQDYKLLYDRSVFDNVALPLLAAGTDRAEIGKRVRAALDKVGLLARERATPITLSGGEQQRVGIARAVVNRPALLLADEPTGNLDSKTSSDIMGMLSRMRQDLNQRVREDDWPREGERQPGGYSYPRGEPSTTGQRHQHARRRTDDRLNDPDRQEIATDERVQNAEKVRIERRLIEHLAAQPVAGRELPGPCVVGLRVAEEHAEERRRPNQPHVRQTDREGDAEYRGHR
jgi:cell division transport system ATP-binding protein